MESPLARPGARRASLLFATTLFVSGTLLFLIQPMFARMVLPLLGGSPAVWNTAMVSYQVLLLAGYMYAYASARWLTPRQQALMHIVILALPLFVLPIAVPAGWQPPAATNPAPWLMLLLLVGAGLPFFVVATTSPLLQTWFARTGHPAAANPYALYAASNAGSMLGLLAYPLVLEPRFALQVQSRAWSMGYGVLVVLVAACAVMARSNDASIRTVDAPAVAVASRGAIAWRRRGRWMLLAFVPSSLMLSVTMYMSTNIAPFPLLWVLPLAIYLLTFIVAFASRQVIPRPVLSRALPIAVLPLLVAILSDATHPIRPLIALHLVAFAIIALCSHAALAEDAPPADALTEFYLWVALGGALGGAFNAVLAPALFTSILEYPLVLVLAALSVRVVVDDDDAAVTEGPRWAGLAPRRVLDVVLPLALIPLVLLCGAAVREFGLESAAARRLLTLAAPALLCATLAGRRLRFGLGVAALLVASVAFERDSRLMLEARSFFGVSRVYQTDSGRFHSLAHGNISHGAQNMRPDMRREPLTYYTRTGPVGEIVIPRQQRGLVKRVAVVGLGAGSLACYRQPDETWTFFEIDAAIVRIARNPRYFTYLRDCAPEATIVLGDARLSIARAPDRRYDLLLLDAYSADAIPIHLLTREALALYRRKLAPGGVIAVHISNQYFDLGPVVAALVRDAGMVTRLRDEREITQADIDRGKNTSDWMVIAERESDLGALLALPRWQRVTPATQVWTDDFASALSALR